MIWVIYFFIVVWGICGVLSLLVPKTFKKFMLKFTLACPYWLWGILGLIIGYLFWQSVGLVSVPWVMQVLAVLAIIKGLVLIIMPKNTTEKMQNSLLRMSDLIYRVYGVLILLLVYYLYQILL